MLQVLFSEFYDLVIFDRDGVINKAPTSANKYILSKDELELNQSVIRFIVELQSKGVGTCVATNQQCVGRGLISTDSLNQIHGAINTQINKIGGADLKFFTCTHLFQENCSCRKPNPGLLISAMNSFNVLPNRTLFIGDQLSDKLAAQSASIDFLFIGNINTNLISQNSSGTTQESS
jgi:D-glycero-D-manno-heptose 1,7-bisphosphate phosphatase